MNPEPVESIPLEWAKRTGRVEEVYAAMTERRRYHRRRRLKYGGAVAAIVLCILGATWTFGPGSSDAGAPVLAVIEPRRQVLPDGSIVALRDKATIKVDFSGAFRRVTLVSGQAHFTVAHNKARPFVVNAGGVEVTAVGTAFSVDFGQKAVEVFVTEGRVALAKPEVAGELAAPLLLDAGHRASVELGAEATPAPVAVAVEKKEGESLMAWNAPRLDLRSTPLVQVLDAMNRQGRARLVLADPTLGGLTVSGVLRADNADTLLEVLEANYGIKSATRADGAVELRRGP